MTDQQPLATNLRFPPRFIVLVFQKTFFWFLGLSNRTRRP